MKSEERRAAIVRSASHLFAERGFRGATTRQLASAAGVTEIAARGLIGMISYHGLVALLFPGRFQLR